MLSDPRGDYCLALCQGRLAVELRNNLLGEDQVISRRLRVKPLTGAFPLSLLYLLNPLRALLLAAI